MRRKKSSSSIILLVILLAIVGGFVYVYNSVMFEREQPKIEVAKETFWNLKDPLKIKLSDTSGIKYYNVILKANGTEKVLAREVFELSQKEINLDIQNPKLRTLFRKTKEASLFIEAVDNSKWNFFAGNKAQATAKIYIDKKRPFVSVVANSYGIRKGGSALVVFRTKDENLDEFYIDAGFKKFKPQPFYKEGFYVSLVAWPVNERNFRAYVVAKDLAGNVTKTYINLREKAKNYRVSNLTLKDSFLNGKIADLYAENEDILNVDEDVDKITRFKLVNETLRNKNEELIYDISSKVEDELIADFKIQPFYPLKNGAAVARFGDHRKFFYNKEYISESYHMGLDLASVKQAKMYNQNRAQVVFNDYNGIYGNMLMLSYGMGLYTVYGHCSSVNVNVGDEIAENTYIAATGASGLALGDHLHFGVLVQGIEVRPEEWMDKKWMQLNITEVMDNARELINRSKN